MRPSLARVATVLVVAALVLQVIALGVLAQTDSTIDPADEIYVAEDGDAVLVYESEPSEGGAERAEFGVNVAENLTYVLVTDPVEETPDVRGRLTVGATQTSLRGEGGLSAPRPDAIEAFTLDASGESTEANARADFLVAATVRDESGMTGLLNSAETSGEITTSADRLAATGSLDVRTNLPMGERQALDATLRETDAGYELTVDQSRPIPSFATDRWRNRTVAAEVLERQFGAVADGLGGSATVDLREHSLTEADGGVRLEQAYTVRFEGIDEGLASTVRGLLAGNPDLSGDQADRLARGLADVRIEEASLSYELDARDLTAEFSLDVRNYDGLALAYFELAEAMNAGGAGFGADVERLREQFGAQRAADLEQRFTWDGSLTHPESGVVRAEFEAASRSTNWGDYVDELERRDVPFTETTYELTGGIDGDRVELQGRATMEGEDLFEQLLRGLSGGEGMSPGAEAILEGLRESDPQEAKLAASYDGDGLRIEAGAAFGNLAAIRDALAERPSVPRITEAVGRSDESGGQVVIRVEGAVTGQPTEADVRALPYVDDDTAVHLPGEWDREFPTMDTDRAESFLEDVLPGSSGPGFGPIGAAAAILAAAGLLARRR